MPEAAVRNVLFIMVDQLRSDHLGCYGHPALRTPNIDALAARGVRFSSAFVNSGVCGPSRMSFYTGRYPITHGATWNRVPLPVGVATLGDHLQECGRELHLAGKSHAVPDVEGMRRLGLAGATRQHRASAGFVELDRYDGHRPPGPESGYAAFLRDRGYEGEDPWSEFVISGIDGAGRVRSGWQMRNARLPARVAERHSETAYMSDRAMAFIEAMDDKPWILHLSYVKPHWPYIAPAPYHRMFDARDCLPVLRSDEELREAHPVVAAYRRHDESVAFAEEACIETVRPVYQGLIRQIDDHLGRLFAFLERRALLDSTLVLFASDHGDLLGDHWLGEKELFYDAVQRIPLIVADPRRAADATRGTVDDRFVEAVDIAPTILEALGLPIPGEWMEGHSLMPCLRGSQEPSREFVYSELDYAFRGARKLLGVVPAQARAFSIRDRRWRYVHWIGQPEQLYDLQADPGEMHDLGREATHERVRLECRSRLADFLSRRKVRVGVSDEFFRSAPDGGGVRVGEW